MKPPYAHHLTWGIPGVRISPSSTYTKGRIIPRRQGWLLTSQSRRWAGRSSDVFRWQRDLPQLMSQRGVCNWTRRPCQFGITISGYSKEKNQVRERREKCFPKRKIVKNDNVRSPTKSKSYKRNQQKSPNQTKLPEKNKKGKGNCSLRLKTDVWSIIKTIKTCATLSPVHKTTRNTALNCSKIATGNSLPYLTSIMSHPGLALRALDFSTLLCTPEKMATKIAPAQGVLTADIPQTAGRLMCARYVWSSHTFYWGPERLCNLPMGPAPSQAHRKRNQSNTTKTRREKGIDNFVTFISINYLFIKGMSLRQNIPKCDGKTGQQSLLLVWDCPRTETQSGRLQTLPAIWHRPSLPSVSSFL